MRQRRDLAVDQHGDEGADAHRGERDDDEPASRFRTVRRSAGT
jgi:hypothetical protein